MALLTRLRDEVARRWRNGDLLRSALAVDSAAASSSGRAGFEFPWRISLLRRAPIDALQNWSTLRGQIEALETASDQGRSFAIEWNERQSRQLGTQRWPACARVDSTEQAAALIGEAGSLTCFVKQSTDVLRARPLLRELIQSDPFLVLQCGDDWPYLLNLLDWFEAHPRPGCYLREVDAAGVDTKFIESRRGLIVRLLDQALPCTRIADVPGAAGLEAGFGLRSKPRLVRLRLLDEALAPVAGLTDLTLPIDQLAAWPIPCRRVFITENEVNGLGFPMHISSVVIFGLGYGIELLSEIPWLKGRSIHYWGDIDTHGFAMLARLRRQLPMVNSLLMDHDTLLLHRAHWTREPVQLAGAVSTENLTSAEADLLHALRNQHFGDRVRLEQERVGLNRLKLALSTLED